MSKSYRPWAPEQSYLLPPSPTDWLPEGHLAYFVLEVVRELDISAIEGAIQEKDSRGTRPYSPRMMTALLLYAYSVGVFSSRKIERGTYEDVAFRVIAAGQQPVYTTINGFRLDHRDALSGLFLQVLKLCRRAGLGSLGHVSLDGSKVQANASKHKAMSYARMAEEDKRLMAEIEKLLFSAEEADRRDDARYGEGQREEDLPESFRHKAGRQQKIREAMSALEAEAKEARAAELRELAEKQRERASASDDERTRKSATTLATQSDAKADKLAPRKDDDDEDPNGGAGDLPQHRVSTTADGAPAPKAQRNFTDADSRIMVRNGAFLQAFNAHLVVNEDQVIVAHAVTNQAPDVEHLVPMLEQVEDNCGVRPVALSADSGYFSEANARHCARAGIDAHIAVGRKEDGAIGRLPMHDKLTTSRGKELYARRKAIIEPVFGQIKQAMGFRRFSLRGLAKVPQEWGIVCLCHNLLKLWRHGLRIGLAAG
jgi:transposase/IS5 family transposase